MSSDAASSKPKPAASATRVCGRCEKVGAKFICSQCRSLFYCSAECQRLDWPEHYKVCGKKKDADPSQPDTTSQAASSQASSVAKAPAATATNSARQTDTSSRPRKRYQCDMCGKTGAKFICTQCRSVHYCDADCQNVHWKTGHKRVCKEMRARYKEKAGSSTPAKAQPEPQEEEPAEPTGPSLRGSVLDDPPERADHDDSRPPASIASPARVSPKASHNVVIADEPATPITNDVDGSAGTGRDADGSAPTGTWGKATGNGTPVWGAQAAAPGTTRTSGSPSTPKSASRPVRRHIALESPQAAASRVRSANGGQDRSPVGRSAPRTKAYAPPSTRAAIERLERAREEYFHTQSTEAAMLYPLTDSDLRQHDNTLEVSSARAPARQRQMSTPNAAAFHSAQPKSGRSRLGDVGRTETAPPSTALFISDRPGANPKGRPMSVLQRQGDMSEIEDRLATMVEALDTQCAIVSHRGLRSQDELRAARTFVARMSASVAEMQSELLTVAAGLARNHPDDADLLAPFLGREGAPPARQSAVRKGAPGGRGRNHLLPNSPATWT